MHRVRPISLGVWLALFALCVGQVGLTLASPKALESEFAAQPSSAATPVMAAEASAFASHYLATPRDGRWFGFDQPHLLCARSAVAAALVEVRTPLALSLALAPHGGALPMPHLRI